MRKSLNCCCLDFILGTEALELPHKFGTHIKMGKIFTFVSNHSGNNQRIEFSQQIVPYKVVNYWGATNKPNLYTFLAK